jgi:hypothetical protein
MANLNFMCGDLHNLIIFQMGSGVLGAFGMVKQRGVLRPLVAGGTLRTREMAPIILGRYPRSARSMAIKRDPARAVTVDQGTAWLRRAVSGRFKAIARMNQRRRLWLGR